MNVTLFFTMTKTTIKKKNLEQLLSPKRLIFPILFGLGVIGYLFYKDFDSSALSAIQFNQSTVLWLFVIVALVIIRHLAYMYRIRILSRKELSWRQSFDVISLWEFASAISPSAVGGSAVAMFILNKEGLKLGKSTTIAITTLFLDLLVFVVLSLLCYFILGRSIFFGEDVICNKSSTFSQGFFNHIDSFFFILITVISLFLVVLYYGVFVNPRNLNQFIRWVFQLKFLSKWRDEADKMTKDLKFTARGLRTKNFGFWTQVFLASVVTWTARFLLVNPVLALFQNLNVHDHFVVYGRNFLLWLVMLVPSTPGASGVSEATLGELVCEFIPYPTLKPVVLLLWRIFDYFVYLVLGIIILPRWIRRTLRKD